MVHIARSSRDLGDLIWLYPYRGVPNHRYLAEICYRFNHRHQDMKPLIIKLLKSIFVDQIDINPVRFR